MLIETVSELKHYGGVRPLIRELTSASYRQK